MVQQASTILPGDYNTRLSNTYIHKEELGDQYKVVFSQFVTDFPYIKGPGGTVYVWGGGGCLFLSPKKPKLICTVYSSNNLVQIFLKLMRISATFPPKISSPSTGIHCKKRLVIFPSPAEMSLNKLFHGQGELFG